MEEIKQLVEELNQAFLEHKTKNDQRLSEIQKKGYADPVLEEQVDRVVQIGLPPRRIDLMTGISGVAFEDAWRDRVVHAVGELDLPFIGRRHFVENKRATGRTKDIADLEELGEAEPS